MLELDPRIENDIESIQFYYDSKHKIDTIKGRIDVYYNKIEELYTQIETIENRIRKEIEGEYQETVAFTVENGKSSSTIINKKVRNGRLEKLKDFLHESNVNNAINSYLIKKGGKKYGKDDILNIDMFYRGENEFNPYIEFKEN